MRIGVLGGTFDPVHNGHLAIAEETRARLDLNEVVFIPAGQPWMKAGQPITAAEHRVKMVQLAIEGKPNLKLSLIEIEREGPTYTVDTLAEMKSKLGEKDAIFFILGQDNLPQLTRWKEPSQLIKLCYLVAIPRPGVRPPDVKSLEGQLPGLTERVVLLDKPLIDISATEIRRRVSRGQPVDQMVPPPVAAYIEQHGLYLQI